MKIVIPIYLEVPLVARHDRADIRLLVSMSALVPSVAWWLDWYLALSESNGGTESLILILYEWSHLHRQRHCDSYQPHKRRAFHQYALSDEPSMKTAGWNVCCSFLRDRQRAAHLYVSDNVGRGRVSERKSVTGMSVCSFITKNHSNLFASVPWALEMAHFV